MKRREVFAQRWLDSVGREVQRFVSGMTPDRVGESGRTSGVLLELHPKTESGIDFEFRKAAWRRERNIRPPEVAVRDPEPAIRLPDCKHTAECAEVWVDGRWVPKPLPSEQLYELLAEMLKRFPSGLKLDQVKDIHSKGHTALRKLIQNDLDWGSAIATPGSAAGGGYRVLPRS